MPSRSHGGGIVISFRRVRRCTERGLGEDRSEGAKDLTIGKDSSDRTLVGPGRTSDSVIRR